MRVFAHARVRLPVRWILIGFAFAVLTISAFFCGMRNAGHHQPNEQPVPRHAPTEVGINGDLSLEQWSCATSETELVLAALDGVPMTGHVIQTNDGCSITFVE